MGNDETGRLKCELAAAQEIIAPAVIAGEIHLTMEGDIPRKIIDESNHHRDHITYGRR
jgi:hypothetical protein